MRIFGIEIKRKSLKSDEYIEEVPINLAEERKKLKLEHEKRIYDLEFETKRKNEELNQKILDYKIKEQQCKIDEEFSDTDPDVEDIVEESTEGDIPAWAVPLITKFLGNTQPPVIQTPIQNSQTPSSSAGGLSLTDEELMEVKRTTDPATLKMARSMPDAQIKSFIRQKYPTITDECLERAIKVLKS